MRLLAAGVLLLAGIWENACAQILVDTTLSWRGYANTSLCRMRAYRSAPNAKRPITVVLDELAENAGGSTLDDAPHLVDLVARKMSVPPDSVFWIFHWGSFSYRGADDAKKEIFLRATFRPRRNGALGAPSWRLIDRATVTDYTDRAFR